MGKRAHSRSPTNVWGVRLPDNTDEIELPRFSRPIGIARAWRFHDGPFEFRNQPTGILSSFTGMLDLRVQPGDGVLPSLSYLTLEPLVVGDLSVTIRDDDADSQTGEYDTDRMATDHDPKVYQVLQNVVEGEARNVAEGEANDASITHPTLERREPSTETAVAGTIGESRPPLPRTILERPDGKVGNDTSRSERRSIESDARDTEPDPSESNTRESETTERSDRRGNPIGDESRALSGSPLVLETPVTQSEEMPVSTGMTTINRITERRKNYSLPRRVLPVDGIGGRRGGVERPYVDPGFSIGTDRSTTTRREPRLGHAPDSVRNSAIPGRDTDRVPDVDRRDLIYSSGAEQSLNPDRVGHSQETNIERTTGIHRRADGPANNLGLTYREAQSNGKDGEDRSSNEYRREGQDSTSTHQRPRKTDDQGDYRVVPDPSMPSLEYGADLDRLVDRLYVELERKMRIERERRGL